MMIKMGEKLRLLRKEHKFTQKQLAERIGVAISAVSSYESGVRFPTYDTLIKLARIYHVSTDYLLGLTDIRPIDTTGLNTNEIEAINAVINALRNSKETKK